MSLVNFVGDAAQVLGCCGSYRCFAREGNGYHYGRLGSFVDRILLADYDFGGHGYPYRVDYIDPSLLAHCLCVSCCKIREKENLYFPLFAG